MTGAVDVASARKPGVLIVDDQTSARKNLAKILERRGFHISRARSGPESIRKAADPSIDYILMDIKMSGSVDGIDAAKIIGENFPDKQVVFVTGHSGAKDYQARVQASGLQRLKWVAKPVVVNELLEALEEARAVKVRSLAREVVHADVGEGEVASFLRGLSRLFSVGELSRAAGIIEKSGHDDLEATIVSDPNLQAYLRDRDYIEQHFPNELIAIFGGKIIAHGMEREKLIHDVYTAVGRFDALIVEVGGAQGPVKLRRPLRTYGPKEEEM